MTLQPGTRLGPYEVVSSLGAGGIVNRDEYAVTADGNRILTSVPAGDASSALITVVSNWQGSIQK
jgi:hypothetical protein